jgi:uncharacterized membrane protein YuzA (DUF378 family)
MRKKWSTLSEKLQEVSRIGYILIGLANDIQIFIKDHVVIMEPMSIN